MSIAPGTRLGPYEIVAPIGAGGMGEVYKARDTRLERNVAIKVLPAEFASNAQLRIRFDREARAISQLSHPHICALFDVGENYLVMELLEGETLADRLGRGPVPIPEAVEVGTQIADALDRAHRAGIVHRDLKPGNVMLTPSGVKLLDFGLAKTMTATAEPSDATLQKSLTAEGAVVGTLQYMAPEQLEGRETDARGDLFALGTILYEMISGRRAFEGETRTSVIAKILGAEPPELRSVQPSTPPALADLVRRCLVKHPNLRWQCAGDVRRELELLEEHEAPAREAATRSRGLVMMIVLLAVIAAAEGVWLAINRRPLPTAERVVRFNVAPPPNTLIKMSNDVGPPALSPDGKSLAFIGVDLHFNRRTVWVRDLAAVQPRRIEGTDGASFPFWSPDGKSLGFFATGKLQRVDVSGGTPEPLADITFSRGGSWAADGTIVFAPAAAGGLSRVSAHGGPVRQVTRLDEKNGEASHRWPSLLPDGRHVLVFVRGKVQNHSEDAVHVADLQTGERKLVLHSTSNATFADGSLFFVRNRTLFAQALDLKTMQLQGEPMPVAQKLQVHGSGFAMFAVSASGVICTQSDSLTSELRLVDRRGEVLATFGQPGEYSVPSMDITRRQFVTGIADPTTGALDVWHYDMDRNVARRLTFNASDDWCPMVSPDGRSVAFASNRSNFPQVYVKSIDGGEEEHQLTSAQLAGFPLSWSADGRFIAFREIGGSTQTDIDIYDLQKGTERRFMATPFAETDASFAPTGRWIAYVSDESGQAEVYVTSFPEASARWQVSSGGGTQPRWRGDEKELFYYSADGSLMAVSIDTRSGFKAAVPQRLFACELRTAREDMHEYDVSPDGQRFLINTTAGRLRSLPLTIVIGARNP
jgi:Tol biopolymer transport system component